VLEEVVDSEESPSAEVMASADAVAQLLKMPNLCSLRRIQSETIEREGKPAFVICGRRDWRTNLIVMGCRGLGLTEGECLTVSTGW